MSADVADTTNSSPVHDHRRSLEIDDLWVTVTTQDGMQRHLVMGATLAVEPGEIVAVVGESGSGKSTLCRAVVRLLDPGVSVTRGSVRVQGRDLVKLGERELREIRGRVVGMVAQDPIASLNPVRSIGMQLGEGRRRHGIARGDELKTWALSTLRDLGFDDPEHAMKSYPSAFSGGMLQRIAVGMAFSADPVLVMADEPTTALDVSLQGRLLRLLLRYSTEHKTSVMIVSHDIGVVRAVSQHVLVMYGGRILEAGPTASVLGDPQSPYTRALMDSVPEMRPEHRGEPLPTIPQAMDQQVPDPAMCPFVSRCPRAIEKCHAEFPVGEVVEGEPGHMVWCFNPVEVAR